MQVYSIAITQVFKRLSICSEFKTTTIEAINVFCIHMKTIPYWHMLFQLEYRSKHGEFLELALISMIVPVIWSPFYIRNNK